ncbi:hypothetical protein DFH07DRAFT_523898 [Mycena maculata]|uniref:Uncharacterized protein n=1 Tax=Mycena maculata TaxID=230809 RepID=A0AAD7NAR3_9AGAR|nr:hypothetical protein DFH07DRAFT_523898 [Mycena maculata]
MASLSDLPQELVAKIVAEFHDDTPNLRTCAVISRTFLPWSRLHLFSAVRLTGRNAYAFRILIAPSPTVAMYVRQLDIPMEVSLPTFALLPPQTLAHLPNVTHLSSHCDPFGFRQLSATEKLVLVGATRQLTTVHVFIDRVWSLPEWAVLLNGCCSLTELAIHAESTGWSVEEAVVQMPVVAPESTPRLHTLRISGDCKILIPLGNWLVPSGFLAALHTLATDVLYLQDDYDAPDYRQPIVLAAAPTLQTLSLHLDPPMTLAATPHAISIASFPRLRKLHLRGVPDATIGASLQWLVALLQAPTDISPGHGALEEISVDHTMIRRDLLEIPHATWNALESALLPEAKFRMLTFKGYEGSAIGMADAFAHFSATMRDRLPALHAKGALQMLE